MTTWVESVRETAHFVENEPRNDWGFFLPVDRFEVNDYPTASTSIKIRDTATLDDGYFAHVANTLRDAAVLNDAVSPGNRTTRSLRELADFADRALPSNIYAVTVLETAVLNDSASYVLDNSGLRDTALLNDIVTPAVRRVAFIRDTFRANDYIGNPAEGTLRDYFTGNDYAHPSFRVVGAVRDSAVALGYADASFAVADVLRDTATLNDLVLSKNNTGLVEREQGWLTGEAVPPASGRAYAVNVVNWALSTYSGFPFLSMAGDLGATETDTHVLGGVVDGSATLVSQITTGFVDFETPTDKRVEYVYSSGVSNAGLTVTVTADRNRVRESYDYQQESVSTDDPRNSRVQVGKGLCGRYWQFGFTAEDAFRLQSASADVSATMRRL